MTRRNGLLGSPFDALNQVRRDLDRLFTEEWEAGVGVWAPAMDVVETADALRCSLELPGVPRENVSITVENNVLTVSGEKTLERNEEKDGTLRLYERRYGRFQRSIALPRQVDADGVRAHFADGVLTITLPKSEHARARQIPIESDSGARELNG